jgi:esterase FrsA
LAILPYGQGQTGDSRSGAEMLNITNTKPAPESVRGAVANQKGNETESNVETSAAAATGSKGRGQGGPLSRSSEDFKAKISRPREVPMNALKTSFCAIALALTVVTAAGAADMVTTRTLDQLKDEVLKRASEVPQRSLVEGLRLDEVREALGNIKSLDRDEWARAWMAIGDRHMGAGRTAEQTGRTAESRQEFLVAAKYYKFAHYPTDNSPEKKNAYAKGIEAYLAYARYLDPPLEVVKIPFEGKEIVGYLRLPKSAQPAPLVFLVTALDSRKEEWTERNDDYLNHGIGIFVTDMPGTGQAPILANETAERMFSRALDYFATRREIDPKRIGFYGGSWSGYWAVKMAVVERARLKAVVAQGLPAHHYFTPEWQKVAVNTPEYLMDLFPARAAVYGVQTMEQFLAFGPRMSLKNQGLVERESAPILMVNGAKDSQVPIDDLYLAFTSLKGAIKEAWVNPNGMHMGRSDDWPTQRIQAEVVAPWMIKHLKAPEAAALAAEK